jgi:hypothetical protein
MPGYAVAFIVDDLHKKVLGQGKVSADGQTVTVTDVPWTSLEIYAADPAQIENLSLVLVHSGGSTQVS